jgi:hypothetical protein
MLRWLVIAWSGWIWWFALAVCGSAKCNDWTLFEEHSFHTMVTGKDCGQFSAAKCFAEHDTVHMCFPGPA